MTKFFLFSFSFVFILSNLALAVCDNADLETGSYVLVEDRSTLLNELLRKQKDNIDVISESLMFLTKIDPALIGNIRSSWETSRYGNYKAIEDIGNTLTLTGDFGSHSDAIALAKQMVNEPTVEGATSLLFTAYVLTHDCGISAPVLTRELASYINRIQRTRNEANSVSVY